MSWHVTNLSESRTEELIDRIILLSKKAENGCIEWQMSPNHGGYGQTRIEDQMRVLHRLSYELFVGIIPDGLLVRHSCDNRPCYAPEHLVVGTHLDNKHDSVRRGRHVRGERLSKLIRGERHGQSVIKECDIIEIWGLRSSGMTHRDIADMFGVSRSTISMILSGKNWKHVRLL